MFKINLHVLAITILSVIITEALSDGQLVPMKVPKSIEFQGNEPLNDESLKCLLSVFCPSWSGVKMINPFEAPKNVKVILLPNHVNLLDFPKYDLYSSRNPKEIIETVISEMQMQHGNEELTSNDIKSTLGNEFQGNSELSNNMPQLSYMDLSNNEENGNLQSMQEFKKLVSGLKDELILAITVDVEGNGKENVRHKRQTDSTSTPKTTLESLNLADDYDENFPVIFNIILWFSVALLFSLIAISMVIGSMDPGRDSIIYRMTSTRMKKDN